MSPTRRATPPTHFVQRAAIVLVVYDRNASPRVALGQYLSGLREAAGVSQELLGQQLGHSQSFISNIERGERGLQVDLLVRWLRALNLRLRDLADDIEELVDPGHGSSIWEREP